MYDSVMSVRLLLCVCLEIKSFCVSKVCDHLGDNLKLTVLKFVCVRFEMSVTATVRIKRMWYNIKFTFYYMSKSLILSIHTITTNK